MVYYGVNFIFLLHGIQVKTVAAARIAKLTALQTRTNIHSEWHLYYMLCFNAHNGPSVIRTPVIRISARSGQFCAKYNPVFPVEITVVALHYYYYYY
jgi:hypothetical protein